jgi:ankyrin repeat protein
MLIFKFWNNQKANFANMLLTRIRFFAAFIIMTVCISGGRIYCQEGTAIDTSDYILPLFDGALENNLMVAASKGYEREIERLISKGAPVDGESEEGATPLIFAVANNQLRSVLTLLTHNPDVNKMTLNNETPLIISVKNQNSGITEALIRAGADIDLADKFGATPLHYASITGSMSLADLLLYYEADCNKKANDGTTPLMAAIWSGYPEIADLLFQNGANLEARDNSGFTPFLIAAQNGDTLIMSLLIKEGIDLYEKNIYNYNALTLAIESNQKPAVELLLKKGDKWTSADNEGVNPYTVAFAFGRKDITELLEKKNIPGRQGLKIDEVSVSASVKFNVREYFTGMCLSFKEPLIKAGIIVGCDIKPVFTKILVETGENTYYQYFDKSSIVYAGIFKDFPVSEYSSGVKILFSSSISAGYNFGSKFRGTNISSENKFRILPAAGLKFQKKNITLKADLEYMNTDFYHIGPVWLRFGIAYNSFLSKVMSPGKTIKWR